MLRFVRQLVRLMVLGLGTGSLTLSSTLLVSSMLMLGSLIVRRLIVRVPRRRMVSLWLD